MMKCSRLGSRGFAKLFTAGALAAAAALVPTQAIAQNYCSFPTSLTAFTLTGNAFEAQNSVIRLSDNLVSNEASSAFQTTPITLTATTSFHAYFRFQLSPNAGGGDGIAFVMHNAPAGAAAIGGIAGGMGYSGITPSAIIEFDTYKNAGGDPNANHVALMLNGSATAHPAAPGQGTPTFTMAGGGNLSAWVDYDGVGHTIKAYLAQTATKPATPIVSATLNLFTQLGSAGKMFIGFTGSTGLTTAAPPEINQQDIYELELSTAGVPCSCEGDSACSSTSSTPACLASGICGICSSTNHAACTGATPVCDVPTDTCVGCLANTDCSGAKPICDKTTLTCRACSSNTDCSGSTPECATTGVNAGECVLCLTGADCPPATPRCTTTNTCVQCLTGADCGGDTPVCTANKCVACKTDADCGGATPACEVWGACGQCSSTNSSACKGTTDVCDFPTGTCVTCEFDTDCGGQTPVCNTTTHKCQACQNNADCAGNPNGPSCVTTGMKAGSCVICVVDGDCTSMAAPKCDSTANLCVACLTSADCMAPTAVCNSGNICVGCLANSDCSGSTPICNTTTSTCSACQNDYASSNPGPLSCPTAALPACQPTGATLAGQCALCSSINNSQCVTQPTTPICIAAQATCGCAMDTDCAAGTYCDTTTVSTGVCTTGCRVENGTTNCASGEYCTSMSTTVGTCMSEPCNSNTDCSAPTAVCNTIVQPHVCVQCLNDPDCASGTVCDSMNHCVQCTTSQTQNCTASGTGSACLASEKCGCSTDSDCGGALSGRICDTTTNTCQAGCRAMGGNGCPATQMCTSTNNMPGTCEGGTTASSSASTSASSSSSGAGGGDAGTGGTAPHISIQSPGCGCEVAGNDDDSARIAGLLGVAAALALSRRRRARVDTSRAN